DTLVIGVDAQGIVNLRKMAFLELGVKGRADNLDDAACALTVRFAVGGITHGSSLNSHSDLLDAAYPDVSFRSGFAKVVEVFLAPHGRSDFCKLSEPVHVN